MSYIANYYVLIKLSKMAKFNHNNY